MNKLPVVVMISGNGSNLQAIINNCLHLVDIKCVVSDQPNAYGLHRAHKAGIPTQFILQLPDESREEYCENLIDFLKPLRPELIVLAGFMKIVSSNFIEAFPRTINIHPSLLPKYKGLHTHQRVFQADDKQHGMTIHWVTAELDAGPIIWQQSFDIQPDDTEETIEAKVHILEHKWYPWVVNEIAVGNI